MSYKNDSGWNNGESNKWENVCYYKCKNSGSKNCNKDIDKTKDLIGDIKEKNNKLGNDLNDAKGNQEEVKSALENIDDSVANLVRDVKALEQDLIKAIQSLNCIIHNLEKAMHAQNAALEAINDAEDEQKDIKGLVKCLEEAFEDTLKCLKKNDSHPILVPCRDCDCESKPSRPSCDYDCESKPSRPSCDYDYESKPSRPSYGQDHDC